MIKCFKKLTSIALNNGEQIREMPDINLFRVIRTILLPIVLPNKGLRLISWYVLFISVVQISQLFLFNFFKRNHYFSSNSEEAIQQFMTFVLSYLTCTLILNAFSSIRLPFITEPYNSRNFYLSMESNQMTLGLTEVGHTKLGS